MFLSFEYKFYVGIKFELSKEFIYIYIFKIFVEEYLTIVSNELNSENSRFSNKERLRFG